MNLVTINNTQIDLSREWEIPHSTVNGIKFFLLGNHEKIKYRCLNGDGTYHESNIDLPSEVRVTVEVISELFKCKVVLESESLISIARPFLEKDFGDRKVSLICGQNMLMWDLFYKDSNSSLQVPFELPKTFYGCSKETVEKMEEYRKLNLIDQQNFFCGFEINNITWPNDYLMLKEKTLEKNKEFHTKHLRFEIETLAYCSAMVAGTIINPFLGLPALCAMTYNLFSNKPSSHSVKSQPFLDEIEKSLKDKTFTVNLIPRSVPSQIDDRVRISKFMWAVTLITFNGSNGNHTQICFEGISNDKYFCKVGEYNGPFVEMTSFQDRKVPFETRSEIWMRSSEIVQKVIEIIEKEFSDHIYIPFSRYGKKSIITFVKKLLCGKGGENCLDWTIEKLSLLNINFQNSLATESIESVVAFAKLYTNKPEYYLDKEVQVSI